MEENEEIKEESGAVEDLDFNNPSFKFIPEANHDWRQRGPYLVCKGCEIEHATWIGVDKLLTGFTPQGEPVIKDQGKD